MRGTCTYCMKSSFNFLWETSAREDVFQMRIFPPLMQSCIWSNMVGNFKVVSSWFSNTPEGYTKLLLIEFGFYRVSWTKLCMTLIINTKPMGHRSVKGKERGYITYYEVREDEVSKIVICSLSGIGSGLELRRLQRTDAF